MEAMMTSVSAIAPTESLPCEMTRALLGLLAQARDAMSENPCSASACIDQAATLLRPTGPAPIPIHAGGLAPWQLRMVRDHIAVHLVRPLPILELARLARLSPSHFARAFKASTGVSPHAFVMRERIEQAKRLMLETQTSLCEIALICGLADQAHLTRMFRRVTGMSPAAWRRLNLRDVAA
jgi:AraC family transcriptional regulator